MKSLKLFIAALTFGTLFGSSVWAQVQSKELNCAGVYRKIIPFGNTEEVIQPLVITFNNPKTIKAETDFREGLYMGATWDLETNSILMSITEAPDYLNGINTRVQIENGRASLSQTKIETKLSIEKTDSGESVPVLIKTGNHFVFRLVCEAQ